MTDQDLQQLLDSLSPEERQQLLDAVTAGDRSALAKQQLGLGHEMANTPDAEGRVVGANKVYVASSPLEHLSVALRRGIGASKMNDAMAQQQQAIGQKTTGLDAFLRALAGKPRSPVAGAGAGDYRPDDDTAEG